jgi:aminodeoxyfutalosine synthase
MEAARNLQLLIQNPDLPADLKHIAEKVLNAERITFDEGVLLFEKGELGYLGILANYIREKRHGDKTYFNRNFHIEPTNLCVYDCKFCSYSRLIKERSQGWEYTMDEMFDIVKKYDNEPVTEVHIVGGVLPQYDVAFYSELFTRIKKHRPDLHVKALTPVEYHYIFKKAKIDYATGMRLMKEAGLESIPGGGAEIFHPEVRDLISKDKCTGDQWWRYMRNGTNWVCVQMLPCSMVTSKNIGTELITWTGYAPYRIRLEGSKPLYH